MDGITIDDDFFETIYATILLFERGRLPVIFFARCSGTWPCLAIDVLLMDND